MGELGAFLLVAAIVIATPGPDTALTIRNTLVGGRRGGTFTGAGVAAGQAVWTVAASAGCRGSTCWVMKTSLRTRRSRNRRA